MIHEEVEVYQFNSHFYEYSFDSIFFFFFFGQNMSTFFFFHIEKNKIVRKLSKLPTTCMIKVLKIFLLSFFNITKFG
jgi:hypothetical protein